MSPQAHVSGSCPPVIAFPIARSVDEAVREDAPIARTIEGATARAGGAVFLAVEETAQAFVTPAEAEAVFPQLYGDGRYELTFREGAWRVLVRYWRLAPPAPVARSALQAARNPLGFAQNPEEAQRVLGAPAERAEAPIHRRYITLGRARNVWRQRLDQGLARIEEHEGAYRVQLAFWRPVSQQAPALAPVERDVIAERAARPLRSLLPQDSPYVGLFERFAPENPAIVLTEEEGDGRNLGLGGGDG
jgi:hypothetical protein